MSEPQLIAVEAGTLLTPTRTFSPGRLILQGQFIREVGSSSEVQIPAAAEILDALQLIVAPGFIDPHIHGSGGMDIMDATYESLNTMSRLLARHGTTAFLPTTVSSPPETLTHVAEKLGHLMSEPFDGAQPIGLHLEGPFISDAKRGAHPPANVLAPDSSLLQKWHAAASGSVRLLTIAPELDGIEQVVSLANDLGIAVAMGHSNATFKQARAAADMGISYAVHTFNAMRDFSHRDPGIAGEILSDDRIFAEIISDGIHVRPEVVRIFARAKGKSRVLLATDAISAAGMPDGCYLLGGAVIEVVGGICRNSEKRLAGSTLTQDSALRNFIKWTNWRLEDALCGLTINPARALKLSRKGVLEPGADADITILDSDFRVVKTFVAGRLVFELEAESSVP